MGDMFQGLVYNLKHDRKKTEELASVGRMIPVEEMVVPYFEGLKRAMIDSMTSLNKSNRSRTR